MSWALFCLAAYLIGSIPFGYLAGKLLHKRDIRSGGSGSIGATNALRQYGLKTGIMVLVLDLLKGLLVAWLLRHLAADLMCGSGLGIPAARFVFLLPALAVILGHMFPVFLNFKGGKGVATAAGVFLILAPVPLLIALLVFVIVTAISRYVSLGSIFAAVSLVVAEALLNLFLKDVSGFPWVTLIVALLVICKHRQNIQRLQAGNENRLTFPKKDSA